MSRIRRRSLLKSAVAAAGWSAASRGADGPRLPVAVTTPRRGPNEEIRVACIGIRGQGGTHVRHHAQARQVRVAVLCDVDESQFEPRLKDLEKLERPAAAVETDLRRVLDDRSIDCVSIATPNHWHALATVWACQAGKDVYVEKPLSHNIFEGRKAVEAARRCGRIVQHGTQGRSAGDVREAIRMLREGVIGEVYMARVLCYRNRGSIGIEPDEPAPPPGVHYDLWLGPAPVRPFNRNRFHYNWHWHWDYGNGDIGNQGVHQVDIARWGLGQTLPVRVASMGGRYTYVDQGETPNTQVATLQFENGALMVIEVRGRPTHNEWGCTVGNLFYGSKGYMAIRGTEGPVEIVVDGKPGPACKGEGVHHIHNFHAAVRSGNPQDLNADIEEGHYSSALCHLANIAQRLGRSLRFDPRTERFVGDAEADAMLTRNYREPFVVPQVV